jgi:geranylgeranyl diphosphate synthase type II
MKQITEVLKENSDKVTLLLDDLLSGIDPDTERLWSSVRYSALGGGKRIRPTLTLEVAKMLGAKDTAALPLAAALEMVHTYSLIHDDLPCMDNDDLRRGKPTNHKVYGEATALLAGDALQTEAFRTVCGAKELSAEARLRAVELLAEAAGIRGMIGGQQIDLIGEEELLTKEKHAKMNALKTGALIRCAAQLGALAAGADETAEACAVKYAEALGLAFQVADDLLDIGQEDEKTTYLTFMTEDGAREYAAMLTETAVNAIKDYENSETLVALALFLKDRKV